MPSDLAGIVSPEALKLEATCSLAVATFLCAKKYGDLAAEQRTLEDLLLVMVTVTGNVLLPLPPEIREGFAAALGSYIKERTPSMEAFFAIHKARAV